MDKNDRQINMIEFLEERPSLMEYFLKLAKNNPSILESTPQFFFLIGEHTDEEIIKFLEKIDDGLTYDPETKNIKYERNIDSFLNDTVTEGNRGDYVSPDSAYAILSGDNDFFLDVDIDNGSIGYELKNMKNSKRSDIDEYLYKIHLSFNDIVDYFEDGRDEN